MAMRRPRIARQPSASSFKRSWPSNRISPVSVVTLSGNSPRSAWAHIDLPEPDSPTTQTISPALRSSETPSTAWERSPLWGRAIFKSLMATAGARVISAPVLGQARIERVVEAFADQIKAEHRKQDGDAGKHRDPPRLADHGAAGADHVAPRNQVGIAKAQERQRGLQEDRGRDHQRR